MEYIETFTKKQLCPTLYINWYSIPSPLPHNRIPAYDWCRVLAGSGRFYFDPANWHFELESDALLFALRWSS